MKYEGLYLLWKNMSHHLQLLQEAWIPPSFGRGNSYVNQVEGEDSEAKSTIGLTSDNGSMKLAKDQYQNLMELLEKNT